LSLSSLQAIESLCRELSGDPVLLGKIKEGMGCSISKADT